MTLRERNYVSPEIFLKSLMQLDLPTSLPHLYLKKLRKEEGVTVLFFDAEETRASPECSRYINESYANYALKEKQSKALAVASMCVPYLD